MTILNILQLIFATLFIFIVLVQEKGSGLGEAISGAGAASFESTKRGAEKVLVHLTTFLFIGFLGLSLALNFI